MFRRILLIGILLPGSILAGRAYEGIPCRSARLAELVAIVQPAVTALDRDTCYTAGSYKGVPIAVEQQRGALTHLGVRLFEPEFKRVAGKELCNFAERYLLEQLSATEAERKMVLADDGVLISGDLQRVVEAGREAQFSIDHTTGKGYRLAWRREGVELLAVELPAEWELISGENKIELEQNFKRRIADFDEQIPLPPVDESRLEKTTTRGVLVFKRGTYLIPQMVSALYYRTGDDGPQILVESEHPSESLINLLSVPALGTGCTVELTQRLYGFRSETYDVQLFRLIGYCLKSGCRPYIGIEESDDKQITATLLMVNAEWGYNHIFRFTLQREELDSREPRLQATLNAYAPTHNLEDLYNDEWQNRTRGKGAPKIKIP